MNVYNSLFYSLKNERTRLGFIQAESRGNLGFLFSGVRAEPLTESETALLQDYRESNEQSKEAMKKTASTLEMTEALEVVKVA